MALAQAIAAINAGLAEQAALAYAFPSGDELPERLDRSIDRLSDLAAKVVRQFDTLSYSVGVGLPGRDFRLDHLAGGSVAFGDRPAC